MIYHYLKLTLRYLWRNNKFSAINIISLTTGMACVIIIYVWVMGELSFDNFHKDPQNLYKAAFQYTPQNVHAYTLPAPVAQHLKDNYAEIDKTTVFQKQRDQKLTFENKSFLADGAYVDSTFFSMFGFPFFTGSADNAFNAPNSIVLTRDLAEKLFGNDNPTGKLVKIDDENQFVVSGVLENIPANTDLRFDYLVPFKLISQYLNSWDFKSVEIYIRLDNGKSEVDLNPKIAGVIDKFKPDWKNQLYITPLQRCHLYDLNGGGEIVYVYIFSSVALLILFLAAFNFINLSMARSQKRIKDIGVKKIIGCGTTHLVTQFLLEAFVLSAIALALSVVIIEVSLPAINGLLGMQLAITYDLNTILLMLSFAAITGFITGIYPAVFLSSFSPLNIIRKNFTFFKGKYRQNAAPRFIFRNVLVAFQFALSIILIIGVISIKRQLTYLKEKDLGFNKENVFVVRMQGGLLNNYEVLKSGLLENPEVMQVSTSSSSLTHWQMSFTPEWEGKQQDSNFDMGLNMVDYDFVNTLGIEIKEGRFFMKEFSTDADEGFVINEAAVKTMGLKNPVGTKMTIFEGTPYERQGHIIGVTRDIHTESLHSPIRPFVYAYTPKGAFMYVKINSANISKTLTNIKNTIKLVVPDDPATISFLDDALNDLYTSEQTTGQLMNYSSVIAILISCLGLFGLSYYNTQHRIKEIGIRKVNGAKVSEVMVMLNSDFIKLVGISFLISTPIAWYIIQKWLGQFAYKTTISWWFFAIAGVFAMGIVMLTVSWQSWKASTRNPVDALRYE